MVHTSIPQIKPEAEGGGILACKLTPGCLTQGYPAEYANKGLIANVSRGEGGPCIF
jgi:hypothetical protein